MPSLYQAIAIVLVIIVVVYIYGRVKKEGYVANMVQPNSATAAIIDLQGRKSHGQKLVEGLANHELKARNESLEYFTDVDPTVGKAGGEVDCNNGIDYAVNEFGKAGADYRDYVTTRAVDASVVKNHSEFVKDRLNKGTWTGRTFTPDSHESYDPISWQGLRRPQALPTAIESDQVPDVDLRVYAKRPTFNWNSGE